jgi:nicotinate-nucleotide adenylyltransferase
LVEECRVITAARPGWTIDVWDDLRRTFNDEQVAKLRSGVVETPMIDISATDIRRRISSRLSVRYLMPEAVICYVRENNLYA